MSRYKQDLSHPFFAELSRTFLARLEELGCTKYSFCLRNCLNRNTLDSILLSNRSFSLGSLLEYLDAAGLTLKIVEKTPQNEDD